ncbi:Something about silencing protein 10 [Holothuria leucospilota]|uniref:Something about silencing protein 10 n=1 Tax=Holothuria leucospilota TaxID=206669 RepID=A0A9Q0YG55_HOLLE|nr:Something about silencing protein 10 [Holothuria leucospilota]
MLELVEDFKSKLQEVLEQLQPLINKLKEGKIPRDTLGATYLQTKYHLYLNYCLNINFYMVMKAKHLSVKNHPVIGRILAYRKLINEMKPADEQMKEEISLLLAEESGDSDEETQEKVKSKDRGREKRKKREKKKLSSLLDESEDEKEKEMVKKKKKKQTDEQGLTKKELAALEYYRKMEAEQLEKKKKQRDFYPEEMEEGGEDDGYEDENNLDEREGEDGEFGEGEDDLGGEEDEKRAITYQISKNKGLTSKRKKEVRNPRVKNRSKFRKAKIRRKGQVQDVRTERQRYGGELSGIRASVVKSTKLK